MSNASQTTNKLCTDCQQFYGNPACENLCSTCFKKKFKNQSFNNGVVVAPNQQINQAVSQLIVSTENQKPQEVITGEQQNNQIVEEITKPKQEDHSRCWQCKKKVNLLGVKCKCDFTFCNKHRMPEDHACEYDHASFGRELIKVNNPLVQKAKLEKI